MNVINLRFFCENEFHKAQCVFGQRNLDIASFASNTLLLLNLVKA